ncbi:hypothetical protein [Citrobacter portucalensis]|uniref:hypothetical protein n=1 Tax=Citrobacter portucalensis TaxID=1639133 RepID=UPI00397D1DDC
MSTITKELAKLFRKITNSEIDAEGNAHVVLSPADSLLINNARIALASLEAEPVAWLLSGGGAKNHVSFDSSNAYADPLREVTPLYAAPQPNTVVPDEQYQHLSELYHAQEKRLFKIAQRIKGPAFDKYAYSPSQAIDVLESAIFGEQEGDCAAIQSFGNSEQPEPVSNHDELPVTQFKPVADLYGITSPTGSETIFTFDAVEARDFIDGGWSCQEYVELERYQAAMTNQSEQVLDMVNSPVTPDGWVMVPKRLTAENGAKGALLGEFNLEYTLTCHECFGEGCDDCSGEGTWINTIPVDWTTIKEIWAKGIEHFAAAPKQENI